MSRDPGLVSQHLGDQVQGAPEAGGVSREAGLLADGWSSSKLHHRNDNEATGHNYSYRL